MARITATTDPEMSVREKRNMERARRIAAGGIVLLENSGVLPLKPDGRTLALFGNGVRRMVKGGEGSGAVNSRVVINVEQGLEEAGFRIGSKGWLDRYDSDCSRHNEEYLSRFTAILKEKGWVGLNWGMENPYRDPDVPNIRMEDMEGTDRDCAVYVIARTSGEGSDRKLAPGDYELTDREIMNLNILAGYYRHTVVVLNVGGVVDTKPLRSIQGVDAVLLMSQPGCAGGYALADVITGKASPDGRLAATWAENYSDYPCADSFSYLSGDLDDAWYRSGIYVGYRYFDSFGIRPAYPFGFGLSYTEFVMTTTRAELLGATVRLSVAVHNTGAHTGRETVQIYVSQPQGALDKPYQVLAGFAKTGTLLPGQGETVTVTIPVRDLASYDEKRAAYVLEPGTYYVRIGKHSRDTHIAAALELDRLIVTEQLQNKVSADCAFDVLLAAPDMFYSYPSEEQEKASAHRLKIDPLAVPTAIVHYPQDPAVLTTDRQETVTMTDVITGRASLDDLTAQLTIPELTELVVGAERGGFGSGAHIGAASTACPGAAGDTTSGLIESRGAENLVLADGPAGLRLATYYVADSEGNVIPGLGESVFGSLGQYLGIETPERPEDAVDHYQYSTAIPIATMLAQTWDPAALEEAGDIVGEEMEEFCVTLWLAPGMNIQANPLCGRNFEYYSEDPLLSGLCAAAGTMGIQNHPGCGTTIKHFALNNQEDNRSHSNSHCSERALREIYLKGFEVAVKQAKPLALMSSYNLVNGIHAANHKELLTDILRSEWGYEGIVMTDWGTTGASEGFKYGSSSPVMCVKAGNDLIMPGSQADADSIVDAVGAELTLAELQTCAKRILSLVLLRMKSRQTAEDSMR